MIKEALTSMRVAARRLALKPATLALLAAIYLLFFVACYFFVTTREATVWQLVVTAFAALSVPLLFFLLQAACVDYTRAESTGALLKRAARDVPKLIVASLPFVVAGVAIVYLLTKLQAQLPAPVVAPSPARDYPSATAPVPFLWSHVLFSTLKFLLLGVLLPLLTIHTWIIVTRHGLSQTARAFTHVIRSAFAARSIVIYTLGLLVFGVLPYFLIFTRTPVASPWAELAIFAARLALVFALTLVGWVVTVGALAAFDPLNRDVSVQPADNTSATDDAAANIPGASDSQSDAIRMNSTRIPTVAPANL